LDLLLKSGLFGLVFIYGYIFKRLFILIKYKKYEYSGIVVSILIGSLVQNPLKNISIMVIFALLISFSYFDKSDMLRSDGSFQ